MDALRYFKASQVLRVAASELAGRLPLMKVSDKLSFIAEVCLEQVLALAWAQLVGAPRRAAREDAGTAFAIWPTASSAVSSSAMPRISIWYSSTTLTPAASHGR
jgi:hypothetical protein